MRKLVTAAAAAFVGTATTAATVLAIGAGPAESEADRHGGRGHYADVNGLHMYYEVHGKDRGQPPLVLLHGAFSATGTSWGELIRQLSKNRTVISVEQQGHGHTADIDRPLRIGLMAQDTVDLLDEIGVAKADFYGYSMGAGIALTIGVEHPEKVRKLVLQSVAFNNDGYHPGHLEMMRQIQPEMLYGSTFHQEYLEIAPNPEDFDALVGKVKDMVNHTPAVAPAAIRAMTAPVLTVMGDSDIFRPEHAVELFRLTGGGVNGDITGLPNSQLAVLPGTSHITSVQQARLLLTLVPAFLDAPVR
ncbi:MAG: alpha/beta fold hydrolase [Actinophytocola sp.]|uniref:alpha/beta fold hydrolase n=1 Tax=Actinophytocola sp. TaxID=1872138 RepID=UPI00132A6EBD|nr:alpha/beta hydrolase [Actinophytocola sp.]MPZ83687.1 alpha/beta fold hydrolase [Actinophytocola sp.]